MEGKLVCMSPSDGLVPEGCEIEIVSDLVKAIGYYNKSMPDDDIITGWTLGAVGTHWKVVYEEPVVDELGLTVYEGVLCSVRQEAVCWYLSPVEDVYIPVVQDKGDYFEGAMGLIRSGVYQDFRAGLK